MRDLRCRQPTKSLGRFALSARMSLLNSNHDINNRLLPQKVLLRGCSLRFRSSAVASHPMQPTKLAPDRYVSYVVF